MPKYTKKLHLLMDILFLKHIPTVGDDLEVLLALPRARQPKNRPFGVNETLLGIVLPFWTENPE